MGRAFPILMLLALCGCSSPEARQAAMQSKADSCLKHGQAIEDAKACLADRGLKSPGHVRTGNPPKDYVTYSACGLYWRAPLFGSCGGLHVQVDHGLVQSWQAWGQWDGP